MKGATDNLSAFITFKPKTGQCLSVIRTIPFGDHFRNDQIHHEILLNKLLTFDRKFKSNKKYYKNG